MSETISAAAGTRYSAVYPHRGNLLAGGFSEADSDGASYTATPQYSFDKDSWVTLTGGAIKTISALASTVADTDVTVATNLITKTSHGLSNGQRFKFDVGSGASGNLVDGAEYYAIVVNANSYKVAASLALAEAGTALALQLASEDTLTFEAAAAMVAGEYLVLSDLDGAKWAVYAKTVAAVAQVDTLAFPAVASIADGEYVVVYDSAGDAWAVAADLSGSSAAPTGVIWAAIPAANKAQVDLTGASTDEEVGAAFLAEFNGITGFTSVVTLGDEATAGLISVTQVVAGACAEPVSLLEDDSTAGNVTVAQTTDGVAATAAPSGAVWAAIPSANKTLADVSGATDAASVAAIFETSFDGLVDFSTGTTTDDSAADGTMLVSPTAAAWVAVPASYLEDDSAAGGITSARTLVTVADYKFIAQQSVGWRTPDFGGPDATPFWRIIFVVASGTVVGKLNWTSED